MINSYKTKVLVVGAGLAGATIARVLAENCVEVVVIDKRKHIAGIFFIVIVVPRDWLFYLDLLNG